LSDGVPNSHEAIGLKPDLTIVDVSLPPLSGLAAAHEIAAQAPNRKFLFLSEREDLNLATTALEFAPAGFVLKHGTGQELLDAIRNVLRYQSYLSPRLQA
jgi:DNA-binding NarL/FixJ family response regulator